MTDEKDTYVHVVLCSDFNPELSVVCDEPKGHKGEHRAWVFWSVDEDEVDDDE